MPNPLITIYTDGSCSPNPGAGGWAAVFIFEDGEPKPLQGAEEETTNNRMELTAPIKALQTLQDPSSVEICTDSKYVRDGITKWVQNWQHRDWQTIDGEQVKNQDLWQLLVQEISKHDVSWRWVKGHAEDKWNILVDQLAVEARGHKPLPVMNKDAIHIFLGVTCRHSTKTGGWATVLMYRDHYRILGARKTEVTANVLYLESVIQSLLALKMPLPVNIYTSSGYLKEGATSWLSGWQRRGWQTRDGQDVVNKEYWQKLSELQAAYKVNYHLVDKTNSPCHMQEAKEIAKEFEQEIEETEDGNTI